MSCGSPKGERFPIWLKRPGDRVRAAEVLRDLAAVGEAGRAVGVVLAPWEEQTSSLSQRTDGGDQNKVQSGGASFEDRPADYTVAPGSIGGHWDYREGRGVWKGGSLSRPTVLWGPFRERLAASSSRGSSR